MLEQTGASRLQESSGTAFGGFQPKLTKPVLVSSWALASHCRQRRPEALFGMTGPRTHISQTRPALMRANDKGQVRGGCREQ